MDRPYPYPFFPLPHPLPLPDSPCSLPRLLPPINPPIDHVDSPNPSTSPLSPKVNTAELLLYYSLGLTPISVQPLVDETKKGEGKGKRGNLTKVCGDVIATTTSLSSISDSITTTPSTCKSKILPCTLLDAFNKRYVKPTRGNGIDCDSSQMETLVPQLPSSMSTEQRELIVNMSKSISPVKLRNFLRMDQNTFKNLLRRTPKKGRPSYISSYHQNRVFEEVKTCEEFKRALNREEVYARLEKAAEITFRERNCPLTIQDKLKLRLKLSRLADKAGIQFRRGQATTEARWLAERDIRNMVSMASLLYLFKDLPPQLLGNLDATQVCIEFDPEAELATTGASNENEIPLTRVGTNQLGVSVKQFTLVSAWGHICLTQLIAESSLDAEDFVHFPIPGLSLSVGEPLFTTEVCFCETRTGNASFFEYLFTVVVLNFVSKVRDTASAPDRDLPFFLIIDGEAVQSAVLQRQNVLEILVSNNIIIGKGPASTSGSCGNPLDMGNFFKAQKTLAKSSREISKEYPGLENNILDVIKFNSKPNSSDKLSKMGAERKRKAAIALLRTVRSCDDLHGLRNIIKEGFELLGLCPYDVQTTLRRCAIIPPENEQKLLEHAIPELSHFMSINGQVTEAEMDALCIPQSRDLQKEGTPKDQRTQERQRAIILTHAISVSRRRAYLDNQVLESAKAQARKEQTKQTRIQENKQKEEKKEKNMAAKLERQKLIEAKAEESKQKKIAATLEKSRRQQQLEEKKLEQNNKKRKKESNKDNKKHSTIKQKSKRLGLMQDPASIHGPLSISDSDSDAESDSSSTIPREIQPYLDLIFSMVDVINGSHNHHASATSIDALKRLLRNENRIHPTLVSPKDIKSPLYWDKEFYEINHDIKPKLFLLPGPVLNPFLTLSSKEEKSLENKLNSDPDPDRISHWVPQLQKKFSSPVPWFSTPACNHLPRTHFFDPKGIQVVKTNPRVCRGHADHGFGWLYNVQGIKIIIFINEVEREVGSSTDFVRGCPMRGTWDFNILGQNPSPQVRYFISQPGSLFVLPASVKHIVISPENSLAYGAFLSHIYGAASDLAHQLNIHRETNLDLTTFTDSANDIGIRESNILASQMIETIDIDHKAMSWNNQKLRNILQEKKASYVSKDRSLKVKLDKIFKMYSLDKE